MKPLQKFAEASNLNHNYIGLQLYCYKDVPSLPLNTQ